MNMSLSRLKNLCLVLMVVYVESMLSRLMRMLNIN
nr:MAG TPA: hypothetical protein [Bacteriophage sp.]